MLGITRNKIIFRRVIFYLSISFFVVFLNYSLHEIQHLIHTNNKTSANNFYPHWETLHRRNEEKAEGSYHDFQPIIENISDNIPLNYGNARPLILVWTKFFGGDPLDIFEGFDPTGCNGGQRGCQYSRDRHKFQDADAVLFHSSGITAADNPVSLQLERPQGQIWIYNNLESPINMDKDSTQVLRSSPIFKSSFNWTMTYRLDSDIYHPYARIIKKKFQIQQSINEIKSIIRQKTHLAVWPVSHCFTKSRREDLVEQLAALGLQIDIIGHCSPNLADRVACPRKGIDYDTCFSKFEKKYKFVISFENSLCQDYVTEKFFNALNFYIVPIVYSAGRIPAPSGSYIDVKNFNSSSQLVEYLTLLSQNEEEYAKYFEYKKEYSVQGKGERSWCDLCEKLWDQRNKITIQYYPDVVQWYENVYEKETGGRVEGFRSCVDKDKIAFR